MSKLACLAALTAFACLPNSLMAAEQAAGKPRATSGARPAIGSTVSGFTARDAYGKEHTLDAIGRDKVVVLAFLGVECPLVAAYAPRLVELAGKYEAKGVAFVGVCSNRHDSISEISALVRTHKIPFPVVKDLQQRIADSVGALRTPEVVVIDRRRQLRYRGRIDDQFGFVPSNRAASYHRPKAAHNDLAAALDAILGDRPVLTSETEAAGCLIGRDRAVNPHGAVTYSNQIARLLNKRCVACHRSGQIAPFALTRYDEVAGWADMIDEVVQSGRMPPWHADPRIGHFQNDAHLSDGEKQLIAQWVADGAPRGDEKDLPEPPQFAKGWMIPKPDEVLYMSDKPFAVPATGVVDYQVFVVDPGWREDRWISAIEPRPGNPAVVHHILLLVLPPSGEMQGLRGDDDFLGAYAPGFRAEPLPSGMARRVKAGSKLIFQMHYTPNGTPQSDRSSVGITFADPKTVHKEVLVSSAINAVFQIPAGADSYEVHSRYIFKRDSILLSFMPHMHLRGKDFRYEAVYPDGRREKLLSVPRYDFGWQTNYRLAEPKRMPRGTVLQCVAHYDNSSANLNNPDPGVAVGWGDQTFDEMMIGFFEAFPVDEDLAASHEPGRLSRLEQFDIIMRATNGQPDDNVRVSAGMALNGPEWMARFTHILPIMVPQVDRVCVTAVEKGKVKQITGPFLPQPAKNGAPAPENLRSPLSDAPAETEPLAKAAESHEPVVYDDLATAKGQILTTMSRRGARSSLHVPVTVRGQKMTVNYWSRDSRAFPPSAVQFLADLSKTMVDSQAGAKK